MLGQPSRFERRGAAVVTSIMAALLWFCVIVEWVAPEAVAGSFPVLPFAIGITVLTIVLHKLADWSKV